MERVIRLISVLTARPTPVPVEDLVRVGGYHAADPDDAKRMLTRDIAQLNSTGWDIRNVAPAGEPGRWQLRARDNRLRVALTPAQRAELVRAALAAGRPGLAEPLGPADPPEPRPDAGPSALPQAPRVVVTEGTAPDETLADALRAVALRCLVRFTYKDVARVAHPWSVHPGPSGWYLQAREDELDTAKEFVVGRMVGLQLDRPGTAEVPTSSPRSQLDPLRWQVDPPLRAVVETTVEHRPQVEHLLGEPGVVELAGDVARLSYEVTHRGPFRWRLYELGPRVRLLAPEALRREVEAELVAVAGTVR
jgi:predicted DNA-binding transcriptional regulator YafY